MSLEKSSRPECRRVEHITRQRAHIVGELCAGAGIAIDGVPRQITAEGDLAGISRRQVAAVLGVDRAAADRIIGPVRDEDMEDRKSVVKGKRVAVRVDLGGRTNMKKKIMKNIRT